MLLDSTGCSLTLPKWGMTRGGDAFELPTPVPLTGGNDYSSLLQTPSAADAMKGQVKALLPTPSASGDARNTNQTSDYRCLAQEVNLLPTAQAAKYGAPTPSETPWLGPQDDFNLWTAMQRLPGEPTSPPSDGGKQSEATPHPGQLTIEDA